MNKVPMCRVNEILRLDDETGLLHWKVNRGNKSSAGYMAGLALGNRYMRMQPIVRKQPNYMEPLYILNQCWK